MKRSIVEKHYQCLDMVEASWRQPQGELAKDCVVVLEIWKSGALLQTSTAAPVGSVVSFEAGGRMVEALVSDCEQDCFGYMVTVDVPSSEGWFPAFYRPAYLLPKGPPAPWQPQIAGNPARGSRRTA